MKTIGIVGGVAWPSSIKYYHLINQEIARRLGGTGRHCADLVLAQTDFDAIKNHQLAGEWDDVGRLLADQAQRLKVAGADFFIIACNTVHIAIDRVEAAVDLPYIHIVDPAAQQAVASGYQTVGLLGSNYTMQGTYFTERLRERYGLTVLTASGEHAANVHNALYDELTKGHFRPETRENFKAALQDLADRGAEVIILGCTEFGILVGPEDSPVPLIDTVVAHAMAAVDTALEVSST